MLYFMLTKLCAIDHMYQYSLDSYNSFFLKSIRRRARREARRPRRANLVASLRMTIFTWVARGLFERHKLIFLAQLCFNLMQVTPPAPRRVFAAPPPPMMSKLMA